MVLDFSQLAPLIAARLLITDWEEREVDLVIKRAARDNLYRPLRPHLVSRLSDTITTNFLISFCPRWLAPYDSTHFGFTWCIFTLITDTLLSSHHQRMAGAAEAIVC
jgi:hypothetical protein